MKLGNGFWADAAVDEITDYLTSIELSGDCGLLNGSAGVALFLWYVSKQKHNALVEARFDEVAGYLQAAYETKLPWGMSRGLIGIAAVMELILQDQDDGYDGAFHDPVDRFLLSHLRNGDWDGGLEFVQGLAGVGVYASRRAKIGKARDLYSEVVAKFRDQAIQFDDGKIAWLTPPRSPYILNAQSNDGEYNLGLAHGITSVIACLIPAVSLGIDGAKDLVQRACSWLVDQADLSAGSGSAYGYLAKERKVSRLGWCYGDLGIAITLARAGTALSDPALIEIARKIGQQAAARRSRSDAQVQDAGLCHGLTGVAVMFGVLQTHFPDDLEMQLATDFWWAQLASDFDLSGLRAFDALLPNDGARVKVGSPGFLVGYAGVGLAIMSMQSRSLTWGDLLMLC